MQKRVYFNIKKGETSVYTRINKSMKKIRNSKDKNTIFDYFNITIIFVLSVICLYPCYLVLITSLNEPVDSLRGGLYFFIRKFTFDNYVFFFRDPVMLRAFTISVSRTVGRDLAGYQKRRETRPYGMLHCITVQEISVGTREAPLATVHWLSWSRLNAIPGACLPAARSRVRR